MRKEDPLRYSKEVGVYGYEGRIPAKFINYVYVAQKPNDELYNIKDFKKGKPKQLIKAIDMGYLEY